MQSVSNQPKPVFSWLKELQTKAYKAFESSKSSKKEQKLFEENRKLKTIIAELSIDLKKNGTRIKRRRRTMKREQKDKEILSLIQPIKAFSPLS